MNDTLIQKNLPALTAYFSIARPNAISTPYYIKKGEDIIPFFGYVASLSPSGIFSLKVNVRTEDGVGNVALPVEENDEIYYTTTRFVLSSAKNPVPDLIYNYNTLTKETLSAFADPNSELNKSKPSISPLIRINKNTPYKNTDEDKNIIKFHLQNKVTNAETLSETPVGAKNLLYFTIFNEPAYTDILNLCLKSIKKYTETPNFDILIITDESTKTILSGIDGLNGFNVDYLVLSNIKDVVKASAQKLRIFEYNRLNEYKNILFLESLMFILHTII